jgi:hypothetical protein
MVETLTATNQKYKELRRLGRWRVLINGLLRMFEQPVYRWKVLVSKMGSRGHLQLSSPYDWA